MPDEIESIREAVDYLRCILRPTAQKILLQGWLDRVLAQLSTPQPILHDRFLICVAGMESVPKNAETEFDLLRTFGQF
jgi:hypothetical protein